MDAVIFSSSLSNFKPLWVFLPTALFIIFLLVPIAAFPEKTLLGKARKGIKIFIIIQAIALIGHFYAFATELIPYYFGHTEVVVGDVMNFSPPTNSFNKHESFIVGEVCFDYNYNDITFGYRGGILDENTKNIKVYYVYNALNDENVIVRIEKNIEQTTTS